MKRKRNSLAQDMLGLGTASMAISAGSMMAAVPALKAPAGIKESFSVAGSLMPVATVGVMGKHIIGQMRGIRYKRRRH